MTSNTNSSYRGTANGDKELPPIDGSAQSLAAAGLAPESSYSPYQQNTASQLQEPLQPSAGFIAPPVFSPATRLRFLAAHATYAANAAYAGKSTLT
ncbi:unnamed protein product [Aureobasidium pullulans]|nr:unnamed protein product [Aureobasidium pullulans]CAD0028630.1 unnamed protein product [Aureobasidium pullulans]